MDYKTVLQIDISVQAAQDGVSRYSLSPVTQSGRLLTDFNLPALCSEKIFFKCVLWNNKSSVPAHKKKSTGGQMQVYPTQI